MLIVLWGGLAIGPVLITWLLRAHQKRFAAVMLLS
jgi:hypothetical protein